MAITKSEGEAKTAKDASLVTLAIRSGIWRKLKNSQ